jgi:hypothetical protein
MAGTADSSRGPGRSTRSTGYRQRSFYLDDEVYFRLRNAAFHTAHLPAGADSLSELVNAVLEAAVQDLERTYNAGQPFPDIPTGVRLQAGRSGRQRQIEAMEDLRRQRHEPGGPPEN